MKTTGGMFCGPILRITSSPVQSGICTSRRTRSGRWERIASIAREPESHSPATSRPSTPVSVLRIPCRIKGSSSTINNCRLFTGNTLVFRGTQTERNGNTNLGFAASGLVDRELVLPGEHFVEPLASRTEPQTDPATVPIMISPARAVVGHRDYETIAVAFRAHGNPACLRHSAKAMDHGIFHQGLQQEAWNQGSIGIGCHLGENREAIAEAHLLYRQIVLREGDFVFHRGFRWRVATKSDSQQVP